MLDVHIGEWICAEILNIIWNSWIDQQSMAQGKGGSGCYCNWISRPGAITFDFVHLQGQHPFLLPQWILYPQIGGWVERKKPWIKSGEQSDFVCWNPVGLPCRPCENKRMDWQCPPLLPSGLCPARRRLVRSLRQLNMFFQMKFFLTGAILSFLRQHRIKFLLQPPINLPSFAEPPESRRHLSVRKQASSQWLSNRRNCEHLIHWMRYFLFSIVLPAVRSRNNSATCSVLMKSPLTHFHFRHQHRY